MTVRTDAAADPQDQLDAVNRAWRLLWKRIRRRHGRNARGYVKVVEFTQAGTPHLHLALDCPFLSQRWLSETWNELTGSPIVDIRAVKTRRGVARYLAKYLTKALQTVVSRRKYSAATRWLPPLPSTPLEPGELPPSWRWTGRPMDTIVSGLSEAHWEALDGWYYPPGTFARLLAAAPSAAAPAAAT